MTNYKVNTNSELYHHGILGQRCGVRRYQNKDGSLTVVGKKLRNYKVKVATSKLNRKAKKAESYQRISDTYAQLAKQTSYEASKAGPMAYGKAYNRIKKMETTSKEYERYAEFGRKATSNYMKRLSNNYVIAYDVSTGNYSLRMKEQ